MLIQFGKFFKGFNNTENPSASGRASPPWTPPHHQSSALNKFLDRAVEV
jgi:hypothetical protein